MVKTSIKITSETFKVRRKNVIIFEIKAIVHIDERLIEIGG